MNLNVLFQLCMIVLHALMCMHRSDYDIVIVKGQPLAVTARCIEFGIYAFF